MSLFCVSVGKMKRVHRIGLSFIVVTLALPPSAFAAAPIAVDDVAEHFGRPIVVDVLANDAEPDGEALTVVLGTKTCTGILTTDFGVVRLVPTGGGPEQCTITYSLLDETGSASGAATIRVIPSALVIFADGFESGDVSNWELAP